MNKELEKLIEAAGGLELDPNEIKVILTTAISNDNIVIKVTFRLNLLRKN